MVKKSFVLALLAIAALLLIIHCGDSFENPVGNSDIDDNGLLKSSLLKGKIWAYTPGDKSTYLVAVISSTSGKITKKYEGIEDFIIESSETPGEFYKISGSNFYITVEQAIVNGELQQPVLLSISGEVTETRVYGDDAWDWYTNSLFKIIEDECTSDEDCKSFPPNPPFVTECVNNVCRYVAPT